MKPVGRTKEIGLLQGMLHSGKGELYGIIGRRRIGKTFLVRHVCNSENSLFFSVTGIKDGTNATQLHLFKKELERIFFSSAALPQMKNWREAFELLSACIKTRVTLNANEKIVIFLDELPWLAGKKSNLLQSLDHSWNTELQYFPHLKIVLCGSAASWMLKNVVNAKGGLYNRLTGQILLKPMLFEEVAKYLQQNGFVWSFQEIVEAYQIFGGVPYYLSLLDKSRSVMQNVETLCFGGGSLEKEMDRLFEALFGSSPDYLKILKKLETSRCGFTRREIAAHLKKETSGVLTNRLQELSECGFIQLLPNFSRRSVDSHFTLTDEFTRFALQWMGKKVSSTITQSDYWSQISQSQSFKIWRGLAFELFCLKHHELIKRALGFEAVRTTTAPLFVPGRTGFQIDLVFERADGLITLVEMKAHEGVFELDNAAFKMLEEKRRRFIVFTKTKKTVQFALVTKGEFRETDYTNKLSKIVAIEQVLGVG